MLAAKVSAWGEARGPQETRHAIRAVKVAMDAAATAFLGGSYWKKRCMEILLLANLGTPKDFDYVFDMWPVPSGTARAIRRIFPTAKSEQRQRRALRAIKRCLGGGSRQVPLVSLSACLCFWGRCFGGSLKWPVNQYIGD